MILSEACDSLSPRPVTVYSVHIFHHAVSHTIFHHLNVASHFSFPRRHHNSILTVRVPSRPLPFSIHTENGQLRSFIMRYLRCALRASGCCKASRHISGILSATRSDRGPFDPTAGPGRADKKVGHPMLSGRRPR